MQRPGGVGTLLGEGVVGGDVARQRQVDGWGGGEGGGGSHDRPGWSLERCWASGTPPYPPRHGDPALALPRLPLRDRSQRPPPPFHHGAVVGDPTPSSVCHRPGACTLPPHRGRQQPTSAKDVEGTAAGRGWPRHRRGRKRGWWCVRGGGVGRVERGQEMVQACDLRVTACARSAPHFSSFSSSAPSAPACCARSFSPLGLPAALGGRCVRAAPAAGFSARLGASSAKRPRLLATLAAVPMSVAAVAAVEDELPAGGTGSFVFLLFWRCSARVPTNVSGGDDGFKRRSGPLPPRLAGMFWGWEEGRESGQSTGSTCWRCVHRGGVVELRGRGCPFCMDLKAAHGHP